MTRLEPGGAAERLAVGGLRGATFSRNCARIHPFRLARGLARAVEARAVRIHEGTRVADVRTGRLLTKEGTAVRARHILRAAEAWTSRLPGHRRTVTPVYSLVVATAPLPQSLWDQIGLADAEAFSQHPHVIVYGQRSTDDQIVFGGRGAPYHFGSGIRAGFDADAKVFETLRRSLTQLLPATAGVEFTHAWGGPLGIARDWHPGVGHDPATGVGSPVAMSATG